MEVKTGTIFSSGGQSGEIKISRRLGILKLAVKGLNKTGKWLVGVTVVAVIVLYWPLIKEELRYGFVQTKLGKGFVKLSNTQLNPVVVNDGQVKEKPAWKVPDQGYSIYIPKIDAKSKVITNVDPGKKTEYLEALKKGVAEAKGLAHPGEVGTVYLFAHSVGSRADFARYNAVFYLLNKLTTGDRIELVYQGNLYKYEMVTGEVIPANDLKYLAPQKDKEQLVLQTCFPPGTSWQRLIVTAKRVS